MPANPVVLQRVQPFGLSLMKLIPTSPFLYACYFCVCAQHTKTFGQSFYDFICQAEAMVEEEEVGLAAGAARKVISHQVTTMPSFRCPPTLIYSVSIYALGFALFPVLCTLQQHCGSTLTPHEAACATHMIQVYE